MNNTITMFPSQKLPSKKKNKEWREACVDYIIGMGETVPSGSDRTNYEQMQSYYDLYNSIFHEEDLKYVTDPFKQQDGFPASPQDFNIIRPKIDLLMGEETKHPFNFRVIRTSQDATSDVQDKMKKMLTDYVMAQTMACMSPVDAQQFQQKLASGEIMPPDKIASFLSKDYKDIAEETAYHTLNYLKEKLGLTHEFFKGWKDALIAGKEVYYTGVVNGEPHQERVNPMYFGHDHSPDIEFIENGDWAVRRMRMSYTEIYDRLYDKMDEKQLDKLIEIVGVSPNAGGYGKDAPPADYIHYEMHTVTGPGDDNINRPNQVNLWHATWKSYKKVGFLTIQDENGDPQQMVVSEDYMKIGTELGLDWKWVIEVWEGYRIGVDLYVGCQPLEYQFISAENFNSQKLPYSGVIYSNTNSESKSLVSIMKPLQYMYIIVWYRLELALARDKGKVITMDITQIPKSMNIDPAKWMHYLSAVGVNFINPYEEGWDIPGREGGKCFGKGTKVLMFNGRLKNIEDINIGNLVMGPDLSPRRVLGLHNGVDNMYKITPSSGGDVQLVNSKHEIYYGLKNHHTNEVTFKTSTPEELMIKFNKTPSCRDKHFLYRKNGIKFQNIYTDLLLDPYILGLWIGDGSTNKPAFESMDIEIINHLNEFAINHGMKTNIRSNKNSRSLTINLSGGSISKYRNLPGNWFLDRLSDLNIREYKDIPEEYIYTSEENRLQILAGLIDTDGWYDKIKNRFGFCQVDYRKHIVDKFVFIARSLGMKVSVRKKRCKDSEMCKKHSEYCYVASILSGCDKIPTKIKRKQTNQVKFFAKDINRSMFNIEYSGIDDYFGFELDGDHLFLLGDLTIAHNSAQFNQISALDLTMSNVIEQYIRLMEKIEDMVAEISGVSKQRQGEVMASELVGNVQQAVANSASITEPLFWMHNQAKRNSLRMLLNTAKSVWKDTSKTELQYVMSDATRAFMKLSDNFFFEDYDIFVSDSTTDAQNLQMIKNLYQPAMQNGATLLDVAEIMTLDSVTAIKSKLAEIEQTKQEQAQQAQQQEQQNQMQQIQAANETKQQAIQIEQQKLDLDKYRIDSDNQTKVTVAELNAYKGEAGLDANGNNIPDVMEIANISLQQSQHESDKFDKQMEREQKAREVQLKSDTEKLKIQSDKEIEKSKLDLEQNRLDLDNKTLSVQQTLQSMKDKAAMEREKLKAKTAIRNKVVGEK